MLEVLTCIVVEHDPLSLIAAVSICVFGSLLTMRLFGRVRSTRGAAWASWISLTSVIGGAAIWTTHFVAMMGYEADVLAGYASAHHRHAWPIYQGTNAIVRLYTDTRPVPRLLRQLVLQGARRLPPLQAAIVGQLTGKAPAWMRVLAPGQLAELRKN